MTLTQIYKETADSYSRPFNPAQLEAWLSALSDFSPHQIKRGVDAWRMNLTGDFDGRPLGAKMPSPADIRALVISQRKSAERQTSGFVACGNCEGGWRRVFSGQTAGWDTNTRGDDPGILTRCQVDAKTGAMLRCQCFREWKSG